MRGRLYVEVEDDALKSPEPLREARVTERGMGLVMYKGRYKGKSDLRDALMTLGDIAARVASRYIALS